MRALPRIIYQQQRVCNEHTTARSLKQLATALHKRKNTYTDTYRFYIHKYAANEIAQNQQTHAKLTCTYVCQPTNEEIRTSLFRLSRKKLEIS